MRQLNSSTRSRRGKEASIAMPAHTKMPRTLLFFFTPLNYPFPAFPEQRIIAKAGIIIIKAGTLAATLKEIALHKLSFDDSTLLNFIPKGTDNSHSDYSQDSR